MGDTYNGVMRIKSSLVSGYTRLARLDRQMSRDAAKGLKWFDYYYSHGRNARITCRYFGISPQTFYRWKRRYSPAIPAVWRTVPTGQNTCVSLPGALSWLSKCFGSGKNTPDGVKTNYAGCYVIMDIRFQSLW